jgi:hypothetical protein
MACHNIAGSPMYRNEIVALCSGGVAFCSTQRVEHRHALRDTTPRRIDDTAFLMRL